MSEGRQQVYVGPVDVDAATKRAAATGRANTLRAEQAVFSAQRERTFVAASPPVEPIEGDLWFNTDDGKRAFRWDGSTWVAVDDARIASNDEKAGQALLDAADAEALAQTARDEAAEAQGTADGKVTTYFGPNEPLAGDVGDLWVEEGSNRLWRHDGDVWVELPDQDALDAINAAADAQATADGKITTYYSSTEPSGAVGDLWVHEGEGDRLYRHDGDVWIDVHDAAIDTAQADASQALADASAAHAEATQAQADAADAFSRAEDAEAIANGKVTTFFGDTEPAAEGVGDLWVDQTSDRLHRWDGGAWIEFQDQGILDALDAADTAQVTADGKIVSHYTDAAPAGEAVGDLWFDTSADMRPYRFDGTGWVDVHDRAIDAAQAAADAAQADAGQALVDAADAQDTADGKVTTFFGSTEPAPDAVGDLWIDQGAERLHRWDGAEWVEFQDADVLEALDRADTAQATADGKITTYYQATEPTDASLGDLWVDEDSGDRLHRWDGTVWVDVHDQAIDSAQVDATQALSDAAAAQADADQALADAATAFSRAEDAEAVADGKVTTFFGSTTPTAEAVGDLWFDGDNVAHRWDGTSWVEAQDQGIVAATSAAADAQATADGKIVSFYTDVAPTAEAPGDLWFDTSAGERPYRWNGTSWVDVHDQAIDSAQDAADAAQAAADAAQVAADSAQADADQALVDAADAEAKADGKVTTFFGDTVPTAEGVGDLWIDQTEERLHRWDGASWVEVQDAGIIEATVKADDAQAAADGAQSTADGKITTFYDGTAPTAGAVGDLWVDTSSGDRLYRWDGTSWVDVHDQGIDQALTDAAAAQQDAATAITDAANAQDTADLKITTFFDDVEPTTDSVGDLWIDTSEDRLHRWDGVEWVEIQDQGIFDAISKADTAQATADGKIVTYVQDTEPGGSGLTTGDLWADSGNGNRLHRWSGASWVDIHDAEIDQASADAAFAIDSAADAQATADGKVTTFFDDVEPTTDSVGDLWFDTGDENKAYRWSGTAWIEVRDEGITEAFDAAQGAQSTADGKITSWYQGDAPAGSDHAVGDLWFDTSDDKRPRRWDGAAWVDIRDDYIDQAAEREANDATTALDAAIRGDFAHPNDETRIDGGQIFTGSVTATALAALSIGVGKFIQSTNYTEGDQGWRIDGEGDAELNDVTVRGVTESRVVEDRGSGPRAYTTRAGGGRQTFGTENDAGTEIAAGNLAAGSIGEPTASNHYLAIGSGLSETVRIHDDQAVEFAGNIEMEADGNTRWIEMGNGNRTSVHEDWLTLYSYSNEGGEGVRVRDPAGAGDMLRIPSNSGNIVLPNASGTSTGALQVGASGDHVISEFGSFLTLYVRASDSLGVQVRTRTGTPLIRFLYDGRVRCNRTNWPTTSTDPNVRVSTGDSESVARLFRVTSSRRYKQDIRPADGLAPVSEVLEPVWFRDRLDVEENGEASAELQLGLIAEQVGEAGLDWLVSRDEEGQPEAVHYTRLGVALLPEVRRLREENEALRGRLDDLEARLEALGG